jgi:hypothetical protein
MKNFRIILLAALGSSAAFTTPARAHDHYYAGVQISGVQEAKGGEKLVLLNPPSTDKIYTLSFRLTGQTYADYYVIKDLDADYFTFASAFSGFYGAEQTGHAALGANIHLEITSVTGPSGAYLGFWEGENPQVPESEQNHSGGAYTTPSISFLTNAPTVAFRFALTERYEGDIVADPGGHIHGRAWTVTQPGDYYVTFQLIDTDNIQAPGDPFVFHFQAVPEPGSALLLGVGAALLSQRRRRGAVSATRKA